MKTVIMAGGKGTRIASLNSEIPKPMIPICGKPILEHQIDCLRKQGIIDIILVIGHLGITVERYFGNGKKWNVNISYIKENHPLGTAGALFYLQDIIYEDFLLLNGDIIFDINIQKFFQAHVANGGLATIFTHPNDHPYDSGIIVADNKGRVTQWLGKEDERKWYKNRVNAGIHMLSWKLLRFINEPQNLDLDRDILKQLIAKKELYIYDSSEYVKDMGTPERYYAVTSDIKSGIVWRKNLSKKQKAFFLDRDGTVNRYRGFLKNIEDMELIEGAAEAIKLINQSGYLAIIVTNQPVVARGEVSLQELNEIHNKLETLLGHQGAYIDDLYFCPHHPDKGFLGEIPEYKIVCSCRKPKPGMLLDAAVKYNIDLTQSWMIGDGFSDMEAGMAAGCKVAYIGKKPTDSNGHFKTYPSLLACVKDILQSSF